MDHIDNHFLFRNIFFVRNDKIKRNSEKQILGKNWRTIDTDSASCSEHDKKFQTFVRQKALIALSCSTINQIIGKGLWNRCQEEKLERPWEGYTEKASEEARQGTQRTCHIGVKNGKSLLSPAASSAGWLPFSQISGIEISSVEIASRTRSAAHWVLEYVVY